MSERRALTSDPSRGPAARPSAVAPAASLRPVVAAAQEAAPRLLTQCPRTRRDRDDGSGDPRHSASAAGSMPCRAEKRTKAFVEAMKAAGTK
jgi:hypothetical protein